jgi:hypothetical protein
MMLDFSAEDCTTLVFSNLPMLYLVLWGAEQGEDLDPTNPEAANPGLCLQTLMTENSY